MATDRSDAASTSSRASLFHDRLVGLSDNAIETLPWPELARYIDALNEEYEWFNDLMRERRIGRDIPRPPRRKRV